MLLTWPVSADIIDFPVTIKQASGYIFSYKTSFHQVSLGFFFYLIAKVKDMSNILFLYFNFISVKTIPSFLNNMLCKKVFREKLKRTNDDFHS